MLLGEGAGQLTFRYALSGDPEVMTIGIGFRSSVGDTEADLGTAGADVVIAYQTTFHPNANSLYVGWTYVGWELEANPNPGVPVRAEATVNLVGTQVGETPPQNCAYIVKKTSGLAGRANRGRCFVPPYGLLEGEVTKNGMLQAAAQASLQGQWDDFLSAVALSASSPNLIINHADPLILPAPWVSAVVENSIATQRRRLR